MRTRVNRLLKSVAANARLVAALRWALLLALPALWCVVEYRGGLGFLERRTVDWRFQVRGEKPSPVKIVYVDVDSLSLSRIGGWPWNRGHFARVSAALLGEAKVKAIGFDFVFSDTGLSESVDRTKMRNGNVEFGRFLETRPPIALAAAYGGWQFLDINRDTVRERMLPLLDNDKRRVEEMEPPEIPLFYVGPRQTYTPDIAIGLIDTIGGGTREVPAWAPSNEQRTFFHLSLELARLYWGLPDNSLSVEGDSVVFKRADGSVHARVPLQRRQLLEINWFTRWISPDHVVHAEFSEVAQYAQALTSAKEDERKAAQEYFAQEEFKDAVVLIGPVDPLMQDLAATSFDEHPVPKVSVHGNLLKTIIAGQYLQRPPQWLGFAIVFALTFIVLRLTLLRRMGVSLAIAAAVSAAAVYVGLAFWVFATRHWVLPITAPLGAALSTSFVALARQVIEERRAKGRIKGMFGAYVSPQLVDEMVDSGRDPQLGGHDAEITAYFSDIQGFSTFSEKLGSGPLVELMNEYLTACTDIVQEEGGTLDKYIGDAVVAMFGAPIPMPDHAYRACVASQRVHRKIGELREKWRGEGERWPEIVWKMQSRIGLNTGVCMIGNMGSRTRFNYTMMGDDVNLAARMESGAKSWGAYTMVTGVTRAACERHGDRVVFRQLGRIVVMGRSQPVPIHEIVGLRDWLTADAHECIRIFETGLARYYARDWDAAEAAFRQSAELELNQPGRTPGVKSNPSLVYLQIVADYRQHPPSADWDGVYVMKEK